MVRSHAMRYDDRSSNDSFLNSSNRPHTCSSISKTKAEGVRNQCQMRSDCGVVDRNSCKNSPCPGFEPGLQASSPLVGLTGLSATPTPTRTHYKASSFNIIYRYLITQKHSIMLPVAFPNFLHLKENTQDSTNLRWSWGLEKVIRQGAKTEI